VLEITNLTKTFRAHRGAVDKEVLAVDDLCLAVERGRLFTLLGPSGCGKTTTLRCVAGLENPDSGHIVVDERILFSSKEGIRLRANERGLGMVFQSYAVWPHMNVFRNVAFPLEVAPRRRRTKREIRQRVERVLDVVQLSELAGRPATDLSGGQQQRLALARALVSEPPLLLLDEPLSNLDAKLREQMRFELKRLQRDLGITAVYVTHDQIEALAMSNIIAVMRQGRIEQLGRPRDIYTNPTSRFVADFIGTTNFIEGRIEGHESGGAYRVRAAGGVLIAPSSHAFSPGEPVTVSIRPEHVAIETAEQPEPGAGRLAGEVQTRAFMGESVDHVIKVGTVEILVRCNPSVSLPEGTKVVVGFPKSECSLLPVEPA
jgi:iron(III) transport system ATP-binding protein